LGSHERFMAFLIEHYAGAFPTWLAPVQAVVITIADRHNAYGRQVYDRLFNAEVPTALGGIRVELDDARESMQKKIRNAQLKKIPYMLIAGDREMQEGTVAVRLRSGADLKSVPVEAVIDRIRTEVKTRMDITGA
jgi:threonyl-tRNA synthetase